MILIKKKFDKMNMRIDLRVEFFNTLRFKFENNVTAIQTVVNINF